MRASVKVMYSMLFTYLCPASITARHVLLFSMNTCYLDASKMTWMNEDFEKADPIPQSMFIIATQKGYSQQATGVLEHLFLLQ